MHAADVRSLCAFSLNMHEIALRAYEMSYSNAQQWAVQTLSRHGYDNPTFAGLRKNLTSIVDKHAQIHQLLESGVSIKDSEVQDLIVSSMALIGCIASYF